MNEDLNKKLDGIDKRLEDIAVLLRFIVGAVAAAVIAAVLTLCGIRF